MSARVVMVALVALATGAALAQGPAPAPGATGDPELAKFPVVNVCVNRKGEITSAKIAHSSGIPEIDAEAFRIAQASHYTPATQGGRKARQSCLDVRVRFALKDGKPVLGEVTPAS